MLHSVSSVMCNEYQQSSQQHASCGQSQQSVLQTTPPTSPTPCCHAPSTPNHASEPPSHASKQQYTTKTTSFVSNPTNSGTGQSSKLEDDKFEKRTIPKHLIQGNSIDSETSQGDEHNFSELLNLSVCASSVVNCDLQQNVEPHYSIANSITVSDISSLANLGKIVFSHYI